MNRTSKQHRRDGSLTYYMAETRKYAMLDAETEFRLAKQWQQTRDPKAAGQLVGSHLRLVAKIARSYLGYGQPLGDLISEGNVGLMHALQRFDPDRGVRFSTYAILWIRAQLQEYVMRSASLVRMGTTAAQKKLFFKLRRAQSEIDEIGGGELSPTAVTFLANNLKVRESEVIDMSRRLMARDASLNVRVNLDGDAEWQDYLKDESLNQEDRLVESDELAKRHDLLAEALKHLSNRERHIVVERRLSDNPLTLEDLGQRYGISRERVRQIEARALGKLGHLVRTQALAA